jgi:formate transporter
VTILLSAPPDAAVRELLMMVPRCFSAKESVEAQQLQYQSRRGSDVAKKCLAQSRNRPTAADSAANFAQRAMLPHKPPHWRNEEAMSDTNWRFNLDPYSPAEMARRVEAGGVTKAQLSFANTLALGVLAGAFIGLGAMLSTIAGTETGLGYGMSRLVVGLSFSIGLVLVVVGGAELFTGNNLIVMAWAHGKVSTRDLVRNWAIVFAGNFVGAAATALGIYLAGIAAMDGHKVGATALLIANAKVNLPWHEAFMRGVYCNALVCLAVWLGFSARSTTDKILCVIFPVTAFVAAGFEHSIANMYFVPMGLLLRGDAEVLAAAQQTPADFAQLTWGNFLWANLLPVTLGNIVGGAGMVGLVYWFVYLRKLST